MSLLSAPIIQNGGHAPEPSPGNPGRVVSANDLSSYMPSMAREGSARKTLFPIIDNARTSVWMSHDLIVYSNSEYVYAIFPITIALFWYIGGRRITNSGPLSRIFANLTHCPNTAGINNYFPERHADGFI